MILPEGRKTMTAADMAALTRKLAEKLADTAIERSELYQAAKRDAEEAEAYAAELEDKLAKAVEFAEIVEKCGNGPLWDLARTTLTELTGGKDDTN